MSNLASCKNPILVTEAMGTSMAEDFLIVTSTGLGLLLLCRETDRLLLSPQSKGSGFNSANLVSLVSLVWESRLCWFFNFDSFGFVQLLGLKIDTVLGGISGSFLVLSWHLKK